MSKMSICSFYSYKSTEIMNFLHKCVHCHNLMYLLVNTGWEKTVNIVWCDWWDHWRATRFSLNKLCPIISYLLLFISMFVYVNHNPVLVLGHKIRHQKEIPSEKPDTAGFWRLSNHCYTVKFLFKFSTAADWSPH